MTPSARSTYIMQGLGVVLIILSVGAGAIASYLGLWFYFVVNLLCTIAAAWSVRKQGQIRRMVRGSRFRGGAL